MNIKRLKSLDNWITLEHHPFSELTEYGVGIDTDAVSNHMSENGWDESERITLYENKVLDGRHKLACARQAEVIPLFQELVGDDHEAIEFVRKKLLRQHLDTGQRAMVAAKLATFSNGNPTLTPPNGGVGTSRENAAKSMNVGVRSVDRAKVVEAKCSPAVQRAVRTGTIALADAASVANEPKAKQDKALQDVRDKKAGTLREAIGPPKKKATGKHNPDPKTSALPKSVQSALADTWHLEVSAQCARRRTETIAAANWSEWLDVARANELWKELEDLYASATPRRPCPDCSGMKKINDDVCTRCRGCGYLASQGD